LRVETEAAAVKEDRRFEVLAVSEAANKGFNYHIFLFMPFNYGAGDFVVQ